MPVQTTVQMRRDTAANWTSTNPTLASGEWGLETDTRLMKIGDGSTAWNSLAYQLGPMLDEVIATDPTGAYFDGSGLRVFGVTGAGYVSAPDSAALSITGDFDLRLKVAMTDWTPAANNILATKRDGTSYAWQFSLNTNGTLSFGWSTDGGTGATRTEKTSSVATGVTDGATKWIRVTLDVNNGASGNDVIFYTSDDGTTWTQLGTTQTTAGITSIVDNAATVQFGSYLLNVNPSNGTFYRAQVLNGIGGTTVFDANFETVAADSFAFTESSANAATVTLTTTRYSFGVPQQFFGGTSAASLSGNTTIYVPFIVRKAITVRHLAFETTTATGTTSARIGIYAADTQMQPTGNIVYSSDAISVSTTGAIYRIRITPTILNPGNYLIAMNGGPQTITMRFWGTTNMMFAPNTLGANITRDYRIGVTLSGAALPTTGTKWNTRNTGNGAYFNFVLLGWS